MLWSDYLDLVWFWWTQNMSGEDRKKLEDTLNDLETQDKLDRIKKEIGTTQATVVPLDAERRRAAMEKARPKNWGSSEVIAAQNMASAKILGSRGGGIVAGEVNR